MLRNPRADAVQNIRRMRIAQQGVHYVGAQAEFLVVGGNQIEQMLHRSGFCDGIVFAFHHQRGHVNLRRLDLPVNDGFVNAHQIIEAHARVGKLVVRR